MDIYNSARYYEEVEDAYMIGTCIIRVLNPY